MVKILHSRHKACRHVSHAMAGCFCRERFMRIALARGLHDAAPEDLVMISDVDEVPDARTVQVRAWCPKALLKPQ
jgi:hypothetical protein